MWQYSSWVHTDQEGPISLPTSQLVDFGDRTLPLWFSRYPRFKKTKFFCSYVQGKLVQKQNNFSQVQLLNIIINTLLSCTSWLQDGILTARVKLVWDSSLTFCIVAQNLPFHRWKCKHSSRLHPSNSMSGLGPDHVQLTTCSFSTWHQYSSSTV